jgi:aspartate/glutamate racemase
MKKRIVMIDAIRVITDELDKVFSEIIPDAEVLHIVDEGILQFNDPESKPLARRFCNLALASEEVGADVILITCAHGIPFVNTVQMLVGPPVLQITLPMIDAAVSKAERIGLVATEEPIIKPIRNLLERAGEKLNKVITVKAGLCEEAFKARLSGNTAKSDELLLKTIKDISTAVDVIVLAQVSSARVVPKAREQINIPILSPASIAAEKIKAMFGS